MPRPTPVRDAVRGLVADGAQHTWSLEELIQAVRATGQPADPSSVFRAALALEAEGTLERVELGDGRSHYHARRTHHDHIRCECCGKVVEVPRCLLVGTEARIARSTGFSVSGHQLVFSGLCPGCREARRDTARRPGRSLERGRSGAA